MKPSSQYLFRFHSEATLQAWARRLRIFRFFRAYGGHANDGDSLDAAYACRNAEDLQRFFGHLGLTLTVYAARPPQPEAGVAYSGEAFSQFPSLIPGTAWIRQPGHCEIAGKEAFIWCDGRGIKISLGADYQVTERHVEDAELIEQILVNAPLERIEPPVDNEYCICPKYYPAYFT